MGTMPTRLVKRAREAVCVAGMVFSLSGCFLFRPLEDEPAAQQVFAVAVPVIDALEKYRGDTGEYPEKLDQLLPKYSQPIPDYLWYTRSDGQYRLQFGFVSHGMNWCLYDSGTKKWHCSAGFL